MKFNVKSYLSDKKNYPYFFLILYICLAIYIFSYTLIDKAFTDENLIYDMIWLDTWALGFLIYCSIVWISKTSNKNKARLLIGGFSLFGFISVLLILDGTPFGINGFWGDQKFRQAMIVKFMEYSPFIDYYYKDLPPFYPPVYYAILAIIGKVFSFEAFKMIKIGTVLIYAFVPPLLYLLWRKLVTPLQAASIVIFTFLVCSIGKAVPYLAPHAFLANSFFIPWWLYYVERVRADKSDWKFYVGGGIIGGLIFMTYYYPFFIAGLLIFARTFFSFDAKYLKNRQEYSLFKSWVVLGLAALFSLPFWGPLLLNMVANGSDAAQQEWHHMGSTGILFIFGGFTLNGILYLISIINAFRKRHIYLYRSIISLLIAAIIYYFIGAALGAIDKPVNLIKANEFLTPLGGAFIGLLVISLGRVFATKRRIYLAYSFVLFVVLLFFAHNYNALAKHPMIKTARTTRLPNYHIDDNLANEIKSKVFLTGVEEFFAFYPAYSFIAINQHYSNPLGKFTSRYNFVNLLEELKDPYLINLALRHNQFDPVDYFMPRLKNNTYELYIALSNYPNKHSLRTLRFSPELFNDQKLYAPTGGDNLFKVIEPPDSLYESHAYNSESDKDYKKLARLLLLHDYLDSDGQNRLNNYLNIGDISRMQVTDAHSERKLSQAVSILSCNLIHEADSTHCLFAVRVYENIHDDYRMYLHVFPGLNGPMINYDFTPHPGTRDWKNGDIVILKRTVPKLDGEFRFSAGLFNSDGLFGKSLKFSTGLQL